MSDLRPTEILLSAAQIQKRVAEMAHDDEVYTVAFSPDGRTLASAGEGGGLIRSKGAAASVSTLTLIKGALKIMAWTKAKVAAT